MNNLPEDIQYVIYKCKHDLEFIDVLEELCADVCYFCGGCGQGYGFYKRCQCGGLQRTDLDFIGYGSDTDSETETEYDFEYEEYQHFLGPDGDFWWLYI